MPDSFTRSEDLWRCAGYLDLVREQLSQAASLLQQPPPPTLWWGASRREYEAAASELARMMLQLREEIAGETHLQRNLAAAAQVSDAASLGAFW